LAEPGAPSAGIAQLTTTSGLGSYTLGMPIRDKLPISAAYDDGVLLRYRVTDDSSTQEINEGVFTAPDQLTRDTLIISSTGDFVSWPTTGQRIITPLVILPICDVVPVIGQALLWDGTEWCPGDVSVPAGPDDDTWDMQDINSGTSV
jgi:hypothetical protein